MQDNNQDKIKVVLPEVKVIPLTITEAQIRAICPQASKNVDVFIPYLNTFIGKYGIDNINRLRMFIAQVAHESGQFRHVREIWGPTAAQKGYEGRIDLGNTVPGDGKRLMGRGLIQLTGRKNYERASKALGVDFLKDPELLATPRYAVESACWFWHSNNLSLIADNPDKVYQVTRKGKEFTLTAFEYLATKINGWLNGIEDRKDFYERAKKVIK